MNSVKYKYWDTEGHCPVGESNLDGCTGKLLDPNGCTLMICTEGRALVNIDCNKMAIRRGCLVVIHYDMSFILLDKSPGFKVRYISVSMDIMEFVYYGITSASFWNYTYKYPIFLVDGERYGVLMQWFIQMEWIAERYWNEKRGEMLKNGIYNLFMSLFCELEQDGEYNAFEIQKKNRAATLINLFYVLLNRYYNKHPEVGFYAERLCITPDYLHKLISENCDTTPKELINQQRIIAMKTLLLNTNLSLKDIAIELNFNDISYMCRFFRSRTGLSPSDYRNSLRNGAKK